MAAPSAGDIAARNMRALRAFHGWRQTDLAERLGWSPTRVADVEGGRRRITLDIAVELCAAFEVPLARLLQDASPRDIEILGI